MAVQFLTFQDGAVILKHDGDNAIKSFVTVVTNTRGHETQDAEVLVVIVGRRRKHQLRREEQIRTVRSVLETALQMSVTIDLTVMTWIVRHVAWVLT